MYKGLYSKQYDEMSEQKKRNRCASLFWWNQWTEFDEKQCNDLEEIEENFIYAQIAYYCDPHGSYYGVKRAVNALADICPEFLNFILNITFNNKFVQPRMLIFESELKKHLEKLDENSFEYKVFHAGYEFFVPKKRKPSAQTIMETNSREKELRRLELELGYPNAEILNVRTEINDNEDVPNLDLCFNVGDRSPLIQFFEKLKNTA